MPRPIWGAATSAHQVEGGNQWNDWWAWEEAGKVSEKSGRAANHFHLFREDFRLARSLGHTAHRFSLEWSRLEPREGQWNEEAFRHYEEVFDALQKEGLEPVVTLHHFTNPRWFAEKGGWLQPNAAEKFALYVKKVASRFGQRARFWITINEPLIYVYQSYVLGRWPPGEVSMDQAFRVARQMLLAHIRAYEILHQGPKRGDLWVSLAHHVIAMAPCRPSSILDQFTLFLRRWFINHLIFQALDTGFLFFPGVFCEKLPAKKTLDFLGINYYSRDFIRFAGLGKVKQLGDVCPKDHHVGQAGALNDMGWEIYPSGLYEVVRSLRSLRLPILITENGVSTPDDTLRQRFIQSHLAELDRARKEKIPIFGYFYWSLVDNFEWAEGFKPRFGIVEVDYKNENRKVRPSAETLRKNCEKIFRQS